MAPESSPASMRTTCWTMVRNAAAGNDTRSRQALSTVCESYWFPLYAFIRRSGRSMQDAEDLTQDFFAHLLRGKILAGADPGKGRFRTYLLRCLQNFMADQRDRAGAQKRGGGAIPVSFDAARAEERYAAEPADDLTPDRIYQMRWAMTVIESSLELLTREYAAQGKEAWFEALRPFLGFGATRTRVTRISRRASTYLWAPCKARCTVCESGGGTCSSSRSLSPSRNQPRRT